MSTPSSCRIWFRNSLLAVGALAVALARADTPPEYPPALGANLLLSRAAGDIQIDGKLDEPAWAAAQVVTNFSVPRGALPLATSVQAVHNDRRIYLGIFCAVPARDKIVTQYAEGDRVYRDDSIEVFLVPPGEQQQAVQICVNAAGRVAVIEQATRKQTGREDWLETAAGWDDVRSGYVLELAVNRQKLNVPAGFAAAIPVSMIRNQEIGTSANRQFRLLWREADLRRWGQLFLWEEASRTTLRAQWRVRAEAARKAGLTADLRAAADAVLTDLAALGDDPAAAGALETRLVEIESRSQREYWNAKFRSLFQTSATTTP